MSLLFEQVYNPDVLNCLANLSNDEVFTPPEVVNNMLDMLPPHLFQSPDTTFLEMIIPKLIQFNDCKRAVA
jgi:site-specific DNA-methyltransferase (adenine-specific)